MDQSNREEWLKWRKIGSSDAPVILGVSPWMTPYQLWEQKISNKESSINPAMRRGIEMEEAARRCFEDKMGVEVFAKCLEHPNINFMTATLDGIDMDHKIAVEIKCPSATSHQFVQKNGKVPDIYYPQVQHQLEVAGLDGMYYFSFDGQDGVIVEVLRDSKYLENLISEEKIFFECLQNLESPPLTEKDYQHMEQNQEWMKISSRWLEVSNNLKGLEKEEEELRSALISLSQDKNAHGAGVRLTKSIARGNVDYSKIPQLQGIDLNKYRKSHVTKWRLSQVKG